MHDRTLCVKRPAVSHEGFASLSIPTYRASTIVFDSAESYANRSKRGPDGYTYGLHGTPTSRTLEASITSLEQGLRTVLVPSGQAAITVVFLSVLMPGDSVLIPDSAYPPVAGFCENYLKPRGIGYRIYAPMIGAGIADLIDDTVKLIWTESPGSTTMEVQDIPAIVAIAKKHGILTGCDNTWATPLYFKPLLQGMDFSALALTKYVGGHSDLLMGSIAVKDIALHKKLKDTMRMIGMGVSPDDCALALRGMETMGVRLAHSGRVAFEFAQRIARRIPQDMVLHPALPGAPGHEFYKRDFSGSSGVFSVVIPSHAESALPDLLTAAQTFSIGASWGGTNSLLAPMTITRATDPEAHRGTILRISIGLEDENDLWTDIEPIVEAIASTPVVAKTA
ncbi:aminotransferase class I/II-fold pyridoxal phosphate-dependent enzyme [Brucella pseudintermedia]|uniref:Aminotransferase class I/II-fold pyridoxal phosphate-dependent enzyme n=1 Tax=Brucella pseudintermedia TaxID=370111 RepID=A0ABY5UEJ6_9HYPH|nr:PLP-dependent transferase [Brucella pseudintermedia]UWL61759.1 aminotransferase class I/II-fold pyridoxal phosphate-dependent enzyme [Brucella pseudintermedia]